jgi:hypothetical protein
MNNKTVIILIVVIIGLTVAVVSWRTPSQTGNTPTPTPTATATPEETAFPTDTPTVTVSTSVTPTVTVTATTTPTATPTPTTTTSGSSTFMNDKSGDWIYGVTTQTVGSYKYFIDSANPKTIVRQTNNDASTNKVVFTSETSGNIGSFVVNGSYMYIVTRRDASTSYSKFQRMVISSGAKAKLWDLYSAKYDAVQFAVKKDNNTKAGFYLGLEGTDDKYEPGAFYATNYTQQWIKTFSGVAKTASMKGIAPSSDGTKLLSIYDSASTEVEGNIVLVAPTATP